MKRDRLKKRPLLNRLTKRVNEAYGLRLTPHEVEVVCNKLFEIVREEVTTTGEIRLFGLGIFTRRDRPGGRIARKDKPDTVYQEYQTVTFRPSDNFKNLLALNLALNRQRQNLDIGSETQP